MSTSTDLAGLRAERRDVIDFCATLTDAEWMAPSRASGWTVKDVVAHMTGDLRTLVTPDLLSYLTTSRIEQLNERGVARSRGRSPDQVLRDFARWTRPGIAVLSAVTVPGIRAIPMRVGELGWYPMRLLPGMFVFDWHAHLRHDIATAIDREPPAIDTERMSTITTWLMAVLEKSHGSRLRWLDVPVGLVLTGAGGGAWRVEPTGRGLRVRRGPVGGTAARITGSAADIPLWSTTRVPWRTCDIDIHGDSEIATRFLDNLDLV
ncbi:maleylpyruvate isomerase N-terminal domain-containing protein [Nocardia sp. NPDC005825]|uniref:maleylpyruvate isomerase N-terminal domain-containing protein n=1 Tax=unclassified Nocardia TaxID=2637762 RepID=UPI003406828E